MLRRMGTAHVAGPYVMRCCVVPRHASPVVWVTAGLGELCMHGWLSCVEGGSCAWALLSLSLWRVSLHVCLCGDAGWGRWGQRRPAPSVVQQSSGCAGAVAARRIQARAWPVVRGSCLVAACIGACSQPHTAVAIKHAGDCSLWYWCVTARGTSTGVGPEAHSARLQPAAVLTGVMNYPWFQAQCARRNTACLHPIRYKTPCCTRCSNDT